MKKAVALTAAAILAASAVGVLAGCGDDGVIKNTNPDAEQISLDILLLANETEDDFYRGYFKDIASELNQDEDLNVNVKIDYAGYEEGDYYTQLSAKIMQKNIPDIFYLRPNEILQFNDQIANLQSYATTQKEVDLSTIYDTALNMYRYNATTGVLGNASDDLYAFPKDLSTQQLGYNKKLLGTVEQYIRAENYKLPYDADFDGYTWDDYKEVCKIAAAHLKNNQYASDVPSVEILAKSFSDDKSSTTSPLIDMTNGRANAKIGSFDAGTPIYKALQYQADLIDCGGASYLYGTYANFAAGRVCFYGAVGSWETKDYNKQIGEGDWGVMPWPTVTKGDKNWQGLITSAGYVVSKACDEATTKNADGETVQSKKGEVAKRIAISFMSSSTQRKLMNQQISLPLRKDWKADYINPENDERYSPSTRSVFMDVISGEHGFFPAKYSTYNSEWLDELTKKDTPLDKIWKKGSGAAALFATTDWTSTRNSMQAKYDDSKNH